MSELRIQFAYIQQSIDVLRVMLLKGNGMVVFARYVVWVVSVGRINARLGDSILAITETGGFDKWWGLTIHIVNLDGGFKV